MKHRKGSFTIEATIMIPFILFLLLHFLEIGIQLYQKSSNRDYSDDLRAMDTVSKFYILQNIGEIGEEIFNIAY